MNEGEKVWTAETVKAKSELPASGDADCRRGGSDRADHRCDLHRDPYRER